MEQKTQSSDVDSGPLVDAGTASQERATLNAAGHTTRSPRDRLAIISTRQLILLSLVLVATTFAVTLAWKFGIEEFFDPYLPGIHLVDSPAERWEFVIVATLLVALVSGLLLVLGHGRLQAIEARQRLQSLIYEGYLTSRDARFTMDSERVIVAETDNCRKLLGPRLGALVGRRFHDLMPMDLTDATYLEMELAMRDPGKWRGTVSFHNEETRVDIDLGLRVLRDRHGTVTSMHGRVFGLVTRSDIANGVLSVANRFATDRSR